MKLLVINNLRSGYADGAIYDFIRFVASDASEICLRSTDGSIDVRDLLADAERFDAVVAAGGDGTVATVSYCLARTGIPILPFPAGTANLLAENLMAPIEPYALADMVRARRTLDFDLGEIEVDGRRYGFGLMAGAGYDATIMHDARPAKKLLGPWAYFQAAVQNPLPQVSRITLDLDGRTVSANALGVLVVNFSKIPFGVGVTHENLPRDGSLDVVLLKAQNALGLIPAALAGLLDRDGAFPDRTDSLEIHRARSVRVSADPPLQVQYDGEVPGLTTPFTARVIEGAGRFILSERGYEQFAEAAVREPANRARP
ncbi:diacylglycerol kinase [Eggerthellaceae bacterium zg-1084]|uniref:diacylglycerol/lipid kinase family protein n=1 Tax=Berryella wangjianweii TaxID=2734634 RepID=UPI001554EC1A|nr:diacylglycerol kinase family protein [Berryella wangjianweii]NPD31398.1 diacylglycerol kinase [Berryella wangjianweii]NPD32295.1 diacylglycerol kinase [Eggerthellaceae bacterium zg-997]